MSVLLFSEKNEPQGGSPLADGPASILKRKRPL